MERGIVMRATAMVRTNSSGSSVGSPASGVPATCTSMLIGTDSGCGGRLAKVAIMPTRSSRRLAHADDAAAADVDAGVAHVVERIQAVLIGARGDDLPVELRRGVEVVVVVIEAGVLAAAAPGRR